jgi:hypothetical protein
MVVQFLGVFDVVVSFSGSDLLKHTVYVLVVCPGLHFQPGRTKSVRKRSVEKLLETNML